MHIGKTGCKKSSPMPINAAPPIGLLPLRDNLDQLVWDNIHIYVVFFVPRI
jgi:hypothetical protein